ncbi:MAG TPA: hydroxylamine reductase, partial [Anaerolineaceae bacterium]|nr:hydroxylamine reductase [Anaerolineaceae bacterium]
MFCYQCEQTFRGSGCVSAGVCGKDADVAALQDLLIYQLEGIAVYAKAILYGGVKIDSKVSRFTIDALFSTLTNVNFDAEDFFAALKESGQIKAHLAAQADLNGTLPPAARYRLPEKREAIQIDANLINIRPQAGDSSDVQSLKDTLLYGLKGTAAYAHHAWRLGYRSAEVEHGLFRFLAALVDDALGLQDMVSLVMEFGKVNLTCMQLLDQANTSAFGHPEPTQVLVSRKKGPFIVISGHDLDDLCQLLDQTQGKGVNVYTHGEMLPALAYPELKKYPHLIGNYGSAWQNQQREFANLPGCVLMTTNCLMEPRDSYKDRIFTTGLVGWPEIPHIPEANGNKDFSA